LIWQQDLAENEDIDVEFVVVDDDIAVKDSNYTGWKKRNAGTVFVHKIFRCVPGR